MHVPEESLKRYRALKRISVYFDSLGSQLSNIGEYENANDVWAQSAKYNRRAQALRVPGRTEGTQRYLDSGEYEGEYPTKSEP